jgi:hypothetical protein
VGDTALTSAQYPIKQLGNLRDGDQNSTSEENIRTHHVQSKDLEVSNEKVRVGSIGNDNLLVWKTKDRFPECQRPIRELLMGSLGKRSLFNSRLENFSKSLAAVKHEPYCGECSDGDGGDYDSSDEGWGSR